jgi:preprotein translocase subunit YajC
MTFLVVEQLPEVVWIFQPGGWCRSLAFDFLAQLDLLAQVGGEGQDAAPAGQVTNPLLLFLSNPINLVLISAILFMFIVARPQQKQQKKLQQALSELKKNDRIVTGSGIHGVVVQANPEDSVVTVRIDENSGARMTINRDSVSKIITSDSKE